MSEVNGVHTLAKEGFTEGSLYHKTRPSYADCVIEEVLQIVHDNASIQTQGSSCQYDILELGAGTGKFTAQLLPRLSTDLRYLAAEPSNGFIKTLRENCPRVETSVCSADKIPLPSNSVKNVICAQSFHWFANDASLQEIHRVLVPGGKLILIWNAKDVDVPWIRQTEEVFDELYFGKPRYLSMEWKNVLEKFPGFGLYRHQTLPGVELRGSVDSIIAMFSTFSVIAALPTAKREQYLGRIKSIIEQSNLDLNNLIIPYSTDFHCSYKV